MKIQICCLASLLLLASPVHADWQEARCDIQPAKEPGVVKTVPCTFSQRQGYITIRRHDGVIYELSPVGTAGAYRDQQGRPVERGIVEKNQGLTFQFGEETLSVLWDTSSLGSPGANEWTAPFSTRDYDATTRVKCRERTVSEFDSCPAGILRMEGGQASIVLKSPRGELFTINFMKDYVNAANRSVDASFDGENWTVIVDDRDIYEIPRAAIEGG